jgi:putative ABC transport system ATP-binding protein
VSEATEAVAVDAVTKRYQDGYRRIEAVANISLSVPRGALWVLRGPSGSGKTTLLALIGGMITPTQGDVRIGGKSVVHLRDRHRTALRRTAVGFVFQDLALIPGMSLLENVLLPLAPLGGPAAVHRKRAADLLLRFGLAERSGTRIERLSGGERQRGALARALILDPAVLLLDEPTAHLDAENVRTVVDHLVSLRKDGRTIVVATHDPRLAADARVDRVVDIADGKIVSGP